MPQITISGTGLTGSKVNKHSSRRGLQVIKCECGYKILMLPDLKAMSQAIEKHVLEHKNKGAKDDETKRIEDALISQLFDKATESKI